MNLLEREESDIKSLFNRFRKRDFHGPEGQVIKNSTFQFVTNIIFKIGSLLFTIIIARLLLPEIYGLYALALATIILFGAFSDLGIGSAIITFVSKKLGKKDMKKAKGYTKKLLKWKLILIVGSSLILLAASYFIAEFYYAKPIFFALLVGGLYLPVLAMLGFIEQIFKAANNFKFPMIKEIIFQVARLAIVPLAILFLLKMNLSHEVLILFVLLSLVICYSIGFLFLLTMVSKKIPFLKVQEDKLNKREKKELRKFLLPLTATALSGIFFGYIDTLMLGHFVASEFIAFYGAAFSLVGGGAAIIGFAAAGVLPILARKTGKSLENIFKKTRNFTFLISILAAVFTYFIAWWIVRLAYGVAYLQAVPILKYFSLLLIIIPLVGLYDAYFISQKRTREIAFLLIFTTIINIVLNYFAITYGLRFGMFEAVLGACFATIFSRLLYLIGIFFMRKKKLKFLHKRS